MPQVHTGAPVDWRHYERYALYVDHDQDDRATEIRLCHFSRPHMRAFHCAWIGFFIAFFIWFSMNPLLPAISDTLGLTKEEIWTSSIIGVGGTIFIRLPLGPLCDKFGARILFSLVLCGVAIPTACVGFVESATGLYILRLFIGFAGGTFVMCQHWTSCMFAKEVVGTANGLAAGWGNLGAGVTQLIMGSALLPLFTNMYDGDTEKAWRTVCVVPATVAMIVGIWMYFVSDDCPKGQYSELKKRGVMPHVSAATHVQAAACNVNTWIMFIQYATCFGVELTMNNAAALYFKDEFDLSTEEAGAIAALFGWMNLFARGMGGFFSDLANVAMGMRGRLIVHTIFLALEGIFVIVFAFTTSLGGAIVGLVFFSLCVLAAKGTEFGIVPYISPSSTGTVTGIIGAGGNVGGVLFGLGFRNLPTYKEAFLLMGYTILASCVLSPFVSIPGQTRLMCGNDNPGVAASKTDAAEKADENDEEAA